MREMWFTKENVRLGYSISDTNGVPIVLLHGLSFGRRTYFTLIENLPDYFKAFALDFRGHGESSWVTAPYLFADLVSDTKEFLQHCVRQPAYLFGHSLGGAVALAVSAIATEWVRGLIVSDNFLTRESHRRLVDQPTIRRLFAGVREIASAQIQPADKAETLQNLLLPVPGAIDEIRLGDLPGNSSEFLKIWAECLTVCDPEIVSLLFNQENIAAFDGEQYLTKLQCPLLLLQANPDLGGVLSDADIAVAKAIKPDVNVLFFQDADHFMHLHDPQATVKAMTHFVTSTERHCARDG